MTFNVTRGHRTHAVTKNVVNKDTLNSSVSK